MAESCRLGSGNLNALNPVHCKDILNLVLMCGSKTWLNVTLFHVSDAVIYRAELLYCNIAIWFDFTMTSILSLAFFILYSKLSDVWCWI